jgi:hypothetical protein
LTTAVLSTIALVAALCLAPGGVVHAAAPASEEWFGAYDSQYVYYLGYSSGPNYYGHIHNFTASTKCLDVPGGAFFTTDPTTGAGYQLGGNPTGAQIQMWDCQRQDIDDNQMWTQVLLNDGNWAFYVNDGYTPNGSPNDFCIDAAQNTSGGVPGFEGIGAPAEVMPCNNSLSQEWSIGPQGQLQSVAFPGACLDDNDPGDQNGVGVTLQDCQYD